MQKTITIIWGLYELNSKRDLSYRVILFTGSRAVFAVIADVLRLRLLSKIKNKDLVQIFIPAFLVLKLFSQSLLLFASSCRCSIKKNVCIASTAIIKQWNCVLQRGQYNFGMEGTTVAKEVLLYNCRYVISLSSGLFLKSRRHTAYSIQHRINNRTKNPFLSNLTRRNCVL